MITNRVGYTPTLKKSQAQRQNVSFGIGGGILPGASSSDKINQNEAGLSAAVAASFVGLVLGLVGFVAVLGEKKAPTSSAKTAVVDTTFQHKKDRTYKYLDSLSKAKFQEADKLKRQADSVAKSFKK